MGLRMLETSYGRDTDELRMSITDKVCKPFTEKSSSLIFLWRPCLQIASMADATRTIMTLRTGSQMKNMIRKCVVHGCVAAV